MDSRNPPSKLQTFSVFADAAWRCRMALPFPFSFSICLRPGKAQLLSASWSIQSLPFLEKFLPGAQWAAGARDKVGSFLSKRETASWGRSFGRDRQGQRQEFGHKNAKCSCFLPCVIRSRARVGCWGRSSCLSEVWRICAVPVGIFWVREVESYALFPITDAILHCLPGRLREKEGTYRLPKALSTFCLGHGGPQAVCLCPFRLI